MLGVDMWVPEKPRLFKMPVVLRLDPSTGIFMIACWAFINGCAFLVSNDIQQRPMLHILARAGIPSVIWGAGMVGDAVALWLSIVTFSHWIKSVIATVSVWLWLSHGTLICAAGWEAHVLPPGGVWSVLCAIGLSLGAAQWAFQD